MGKGRAFWVNVKGRRRGETLVFSEHVVTVAVVSSGREGQKARRGSDHEI